MSPNLLNQLQQRTRRHFFRDCGVGVGKIALASLLAGTLTSCSSEPETASMPETDFKPLERRNAPKETDFPATAKRVIFMFQAGAPSQLDLFDYKPKLIDLEGKPLPNSITDGQRFIFARPDAAVLAPRFKFAKHGECGAEISEMLPWHAKIVDEIAIVRSCTTDQINHAPAQLMLNTGNSLPGRPSMGSWLSYGLGNEAEDLPSFVVLKSGANLSGGASLWSSGVLPGLHQGVPFRSSSDPILHVANPIGFDREAQRDSLDMIRRLNELQSTMVADQEIDTRINAYEMAYKMQSRAPELMDWSDETEETLNMYGAKEGDSSFANNCLMARRLAERGVRFIQVYHAGWDHHDDIEKGLKEQCKNTDQASAALIMDLKQRGLLEDTLVIWGGEFGRTPMIESSTALKRKNGRDHHAKAYTMWFAGGGIKKGVSIGASDELGFQVAERPVTMHEIQATILHCMGIDHKRLAVNVQGLPVRLTGVEEQEVVKELLA